MYLINKPYDIVYEGRRACPSGRENLCSILRHEKGNLQRKHARGNNGIATTCGATFGLVLLGGRMCSADACSGEPTFLGLMFPGRSRLVRVGVVGLELGSTF